MAVRVCNVGSVHLILLVPSAKAMKMISWSWSLHTGPQLAQRSRRHS